MSTIPEGLPNIRIVDHPLVAHRLGLLRAEATPRASFRRILDEITSLIAYEATRDLARRAGETRTPVGLAEVGAVETESALVVPILRAGLGSVPAVLELLPGAVVGFVGIVRDEQTKEPREYLLKLPPDPGGPVLVVDPMVATAGTARHTLDVLNRHGIEDRRIRFVALVAAPKGARHLLETHPEVPVHVASLDARLDDDKHIVPGVGDVGDRLFGTPETVRTG